MSADSDLTSFSPLVEKYTMAAKIMDTPPKTTAAKNQPFASEAPPLVKAPTRITGHALPMKIAKALMKELVNPG